VPPKILIVDDEKPIAEILQYNLEKEGFQVIVAYDGEEALKLAELEKPALIILDIMLPKRDGYTICRELRQLMNVPIVMLTAKDMEMDKVYGLEVGADDYVTKPFSAREVTARVRAILRRSQGKEPEQNVPMQVINYGSLTLDQNEFQAYKEGKPIELTKREFSLLLYMAVRPNHVFARDHLLDQVWGYDYIGDERTVDVTIRRLREKVEHNPSKPVYIHTKRGVGYYFKWR